MMDYGCEAIALASSHVATKATGGLWSSHFNTAATPSLHTVTKFRLKLQELAANSGNHK